MSEERTSRSLVNELRFYVKHAGLGSSAWILYAITGSVILALLDTVAVAAMAPLMQLFTDPGAENFAARFVTEVLGIVDTSSIILILAGMIGIFFIAKSVGTIFFRWWLLGRTTHVAASASSELMRKFTLESYEKHRTREAARMQRDISTANEQAASVLLALVGMLSDVFLLLLVAAVLMFVSPFVTIFAVLLFGGVLGLIQRFLRNAQIRIGKQNAQSGLESLQYLIPVIFGFREVRVTSTGHSFVKGYKMARLKFARASRMLSITSELPRYMMEIVFLVAIMGIAAFLFATGTPQAALSVLAVFAAASLRALPTLNRVAASLATIRSNRIGLDIVNEAVQELDKEPCHDEIPASDAEYSGDIVLDGVTFMYEDSDEATINQLSLSIKENTTVAFTGSSGAGKSTVIDLVLGLLRATSGDITCGSKSIYDDVAAWYAGIGVVAQDVYLLNDSVARNIAFGPQSNEVDQEKLTRAIEQAQLSDVIASLPEGVETKIGERGVRLSGGQRQRLGIARALYRNPNILILDEATSALDNLTEHAISNLLQELEGRMTVIIVAHRLSTVRGADEIFFMKDGKVEAQGTFTQLSDSNKEFSRLVELGAL